ncbi:hypothetical protein T439DRAFT_320010 [Meredithblackwellia eburnea MCA 4105]
MAAEAESSEFVLEAGRAGPLRRSRTGCLTCRKRKKKCPEEYEGDVCTRCKIGGWKCVQPDPAHKTVRRRPKKAGAATASVEPIHESTEVSGKDSSTPSEFCLSNSSGPATSSAPQSNPTQSSISISYSPSSFPPASTLTSNSNPAFQLPTIPHPLVGGGTPDFHSSLLDLPPDALDALSAAMLSHPIVPSLDLMADHEGIQSAGPSGLTSFVSGSVEASGSRNSLATASGAVGDGFGASGNPFNFESPLNATGMEWISGSEMEWLNSFAMGADFVLPFAGADDGQGVAGAQSRMDGVQQVLPAGEEESVSRPLDHPTVGSSDATSSLTSGSPYDSQSNSSAITAGLSRIQTNVAAAPFSASTPRPGMATRNMETATSSSKSTTSSRKKSIRNALSSEISFAELLAAPSKKQTDELLLKFYREHLVPAWSITYPVGIREQQVAKCLQITSRYEVTRQTCRVAAAAYISLFQNHDSGSGWPPQENPATLPPELLSLRVDPIKMVEETLASFAAPTDALVTLEAQLWALSDLHIALGALNLPSRSFEIVSMAEKLLIFAFGPTPTISLSHLHAYSSFAIHAFAMIDFARSLAQRRPTFLKFTYDPTDDGEDDATEAPSGSHENWFGLPANLAVLLVETANLCAQAQEHASVAEVPSLLVMDGDALLQRLDKWRPEFSVYDEGQPRHPVSMAAEMTVQQETWRLTGQVLVHRVVLRRTPQHRDLAALVDKIMGTLKAISVLSQGRRNFESKLIDWWMALYTTPTFIVGSLVTGEDRRFCKRFIEAAGREPALLNMVRLLEETWAVSDSRGVCVDWFEISQKRGNLLFF